MPDPLAALVICSHELLLEACQVPAFVKLIVLLDVALLGRFADSGVRIGTTDSANCADVATPGIDAVMPTVCCEAVVTTGEYRPAADIDPSVEAQLIWP